MSDKTYPKYSDEFKKSIVTLYQNGKSMSQLSREYGISMSALSKWIKNFSEVKIDDDTVVTAQQIKDLQKRNAMLGASAVFCFVPFILMAAGVVFGILHWAYLFTLILLPMAIFLWDSIRKFLYDIPVPLTVRPWMGPMGKFDKYCEAGIGWFMLRWLTARNLISFFALILLIVNVILKITHTLL